MIIDDFIESWDDDATLAAQNEDHEDGNQDDPKPPVDKVSEIQEEEYEEEIPLDKTDTDTEDKDAVSYFLFAKESGLIDVPDDFEFDGTTEGIIKAQQITQQNLAIKAYRDIYEALPDQIKPLIEYGLTGGTSLEDYLQAYKEVDYDNVDIEDPINQRLVVRDWYKSIKPDFTDEKIDAMIGRLEAGNILKDEAISAIEDLKGFHEKRKADFLENHRKQLEAQEQSKREEAEKLKQSIEKMEVDSLRKNRLNSFIFTPISKNGKNTTEFDYALDSALNNNEHLVQLADILADYDPRIGFNFDRLKKKLTTETTKKFKNVIQKQLDTKTKPGSSTRTSEESAGLYALFDY